MCAFPTNPIPATANQIPRYAAEIEEDLTCFLMFMFFCISEKKSLIKKYIELCATKNIKGRRTKHGNG